MSSSNSHSIDRMFNSSTGSIILKDIIPKVFEDFVVRSLDPDVVGFSDHISMDTPPPKKSPIHRPRKEPHSSVGKRRAKDIKRITESSLSSMNRDPIPRPTVADRHHSSSSARHLLSLSSLGVGSSSPVSLRRKTPSLRDLKRDHSSISDQVKNMNTDCNEYKLLKKKYIYESSERKWLYNEVIELKGNIRVFSRCRPLNQAEITNGSSSVVEFDSYQENELQIVSSDSSKKKFKFDFVFKPKDNQEAVFAQTKPIVTLGLDGYNVCIFAYGQTGTGKTFTMEGTPENRGVNYRTLEELFHISKDKTGVMRYELFVSMLEVYNEKIRDLLVENSNQHAKNICEPKNPRPKEEGTNAWGCQETADYSGEEAAR
ncbi:kinesin-like protein KIN-14S [Pistacia vera]|uniref:kinesin-like protein KIN-14S n=1 Tax=Pistacia vera TaxID=55513 RepID=UPI0012636BB4|nr:kinesin-like protein KIN-14S [Pistacia vera]